MFLVGDGLHGMFIPLTPQPFFLNDHSSLFYFVAVLLFTQLWVNIEQNLFSYSSYVIFSWVFSNFRRPRPSSLLYIGATRRSKYYNSQFLCTIIILRYYYYLRCAYSSSWFMYTKRYNIVKDNYSYKTAPLKRRENSLQSPIYFSGIMLKCMHWYVRSLSAT